MAELPKPEELLGRGGAWFASGAVQLHLGAEANFTPARKAHPALRCDDLGALEQRLRAIGLAPTVGRTTDGIRQIYVDDPFGNRLESIG